MNKNSLFILLLALGFLFSCVHNDTFNPKTQLTEDLKKISDFLEGYDPKAQKVDDGIWYTIDTVGLGRYPVVSDSIEIEYSISDIPKLDVLYTSERPGTKGFKLKLLSNLIAGLQFGLPRFPVGSYGRLYIPSGLAFGTVGNPAIGYDSHGNPLLGSNTNLLIEIKLVSTKGNVFSSDTTALVKYLGTIAGSLYADKKVLLKDNASGIHYWYDTLIAGKPHPDLLTHSMINVTYSTKVLNTVNPFDTLTNVTVDLTKQVTAWKIILPKISQGSTVHMYVPSGYAYGSLLFPSDNSTLKSNSNLIYIVKLDSVY